MAENHCSTVGIDSTGNIMPESITTGMSSNKAEASSATSWLLAMLEMSRPRESANKIYKVETARIQNNEPERGTPRT